MSSVITWTTAVSTFLTYCEVWVTAIVHKIDFIQCLGFVNY